MEKNERLEYLLGELRAEERAEERLEYLLGEIRAEERLEYLRGELRAERISYDELHELQSLAGYIKPDDVELLEAAGVPENQRDNL